MWRYEISASRSVPRGVESADNAHWGEWPPGSSGPTHASPRLTAQQIGWRTGDGLGKPRLTKDLSIVHRNLQG